ncbi:hypothetical protein KBZ10_03340 [Streptomyces sp. F63]|nr:hypothetical protein [Streptomyces sp. F63]
MLEMSEWPAVTLRVLPFSNEQFIEVTQPLLYAAGVVPQLDTVQKDSPSGSHHLDAEAELEKHRALLDIAESVSLDVGRSRQLIADVAREL